VVAGGEIARAPLMMTSLQTAHTAPGPEPPHFDVDTTYVEPSGRTLAVRAGGDLQAALNNARPGDVITLEAGNGAPCLSEVWNSQTRGDENIDRNNMAAPTGTAR